MSVWAVTMVRDELDILIPTLGYLVAGKVAGIVIADNRSSDGIKRELQRLAHREPQIEWIILDDPEIGYHQSRKMTTLTRLAFQAGADWVIPFDADEAWYSTCSRCTLAQEIERHDVDVLSVPLHNYFPTQRDDTWTLNPLCRITYRDPRPDPRRKVIVRNDPKIVIASGSHDVTSNRPLRWSTTDIEIAHYPWRRYGQFETKVRNGYEACRASGVPSDVGAHWRYYGDILETQGQIALRDIFHKWHFDPPMVLQRYPVAAANLGPPVPIDF